jgi:hypothetical protein
MDQKNTQQNSEDILKEGDEILKKLKQVNADFTDKTKKILTDVNENIDSTEKDFDKTETKLKEFEKDTSDEIDKIVIESVS